MRVSSARIRFNQRGFTLIELVIIIIVLGILAAVAIPKFSGMATSSRINATKQEMKSLKTAIVGDPSAVAGGEYISRGFEGDVGFTPSRLPDLVVKPDSVSLYNPLTRLGWNGPYIDSSNSEYLTDAWGVAYTFAPALRTITSIGGTDTIRMTF